MPSAKGALPQGDSVLASTAWLVFLGLVPTFFAYQWFFSGLATVPAATASVITLLEPVTATVIAVGVLGESLTITTITGTVLLLAAVALLAGRTST